MECIHCKGRMVRGTAPFSLDRKGYHVSWDAVPACAKQRGRESIRACDKQINNFRESFESHHQSEVCTSAHLIRPVSPPKWSQNTILIVRPDSQGYAR